MGKSSIFKTMFGLINYSNIIVMRRKQINILLLYST